jgi:hypothetical protein
VGVVSRKKEPNVLFSTDMCLMRIFIHLGLLVSAIIISVIKSGERRTCSILLVDISVAYLHTNSTNEVKHKTISLCRYIISRFYKKRDCYKPIIEASWPVNIYALVVCFMLL